VAAGCVAALGGLGSVAVICADADIKATAQALRSAGLAFTVLGSDGSAMGSPDGAPSSPDEMPGTGAPDISDISDISDAADRLTLVPVTLAKGLEFDHVIVVEPDRIAGAERRGLHRLYVALTRAVSRLTVLHTGPLPEALR
ncbi:MAG TPA: ATP-binding domain-containing protein, partial [Streptosporangiaceae bacterium]